MSRIARACAYIAVWAACLTLAAPLRSAVAAEKTSARKSQAWEATGQNIYDVSGQAEAGEQGSQAPDSIDVSPDAVRQARDTWRSPDVPALMRQTYHDLAERINAADFSPPGQVGYNEPAGLRRSPTRILPGAPRQDRPIGSASPAREDKTATAPIPVDLSNAPVPESGKSQPRGAPNMASGAPIPAGAPASGSQGQAWSRGAGFVQEDRQPGQSDADRAARYMSQAMAELKTAPERALVSADKAVMLFPESADAHVMRAVVFERLNMQEEELRDLKAAADIDPKRFQRFYEAAQGGGSHLFEPASSDSGQLMEAVLNRAAGPVRRPPAFWVLPFAVLGALVLLLLPGVKRAHDRLEPRLERWSGLLRLWSKSFGRWKAPSVNGSGHAAPGAPKEARAAPAQAPPPARHVTHVSGPHTPAQRLRQDQLLADKYLLARPLGFDGTVEVWKGFDRTLDRSVLIKRIYAGTRPSDEGARRLEEARSAGGLHHLNVVDLYEILDLPTGLYVVYEYNSGKSLRDILREKGKLSLGQVRDILIPVCKALEHAHQRGLVHGGLSPERIHVTNQRYVQVSDFVLARTTGAGSEPYAAPEAKRGEPRPVSDIYSMGICFFEMLTGELPGDSAYEPESSIAMLVEKALDLDYRSRLSSAREFLALLQRLPDIIAVPGPRGEKTPGEAQPADEAKPAGEAAPAAGAPQENEVKAPANGNGKDGGGKDPDPELDTGRS